MRDSTAEPCPCACPAPGFLREPGSAFYCFSRGSSPGLWLQKGMCLPQGPHDLAVPGLLQAALFPLPPFILRMEGPSPASSRPRHRAASWLAERAFAPRGASPSCRRPESGLVSKRAPPFSRRSPRLPCAQRLADLSVSHGLAPSQSVMPPPERQAGVNWRIGLSISSASRPLPIR